MNSNQKANYSDSYRLKSTQWYQIIVAYCVIRFFLSPIPLISYKKKNPQMHLFSKKLPKFGLLSNTLTHKEWLASNFSPQYHPWIKH